MKSWSNSVRFGVGIALLIAGAAAFIGAWAAMLATLDTETRGDPGLWVVCGAGFVALLAGIMICILASLRWRESRSPGGGDHP